MFTEFIISDAIPKLKSMDITKQIFLKFWPLLIEVSERGILALIEFSSR